MDIIEKRELLKQNITKLRCEITDFTDETNLADLKLDSLDIVELQIMYEDAVGHEIDDISRPLITIGDLLALMV